MSTKKGVYVIRVTGGKMHDLDVPASVLALMSRGRYPLSGEQGRPEREELAALLDGLQIADALRDGRALVVSGEDGAWVFRET